MLIRLTLWTLFSVAVFYDLHRLNGGISFNGPIAFALALNSIAISWCLCLLIDFLAKEKSRAFFSAGLAFVCAIGFYYFLQTKSFFSYSLFMNHVGNAANASGFSFFFTLAHEIFFFYHFANATLFSLLIYFSYRVNLNSYKPHWLNGRIGRAGLLVLCFSYLIFSIFHFSFQLHPVSYTLKSVYDHYAPPQNQLSLLASRNFSIPSKAVASKFTEYRNPPHIFLIIVESLNRRTLQERLPNRELVTPFLHQLSQKHFSMENYFSNSVYTSKGHFAIFCSQIPHLKKPEFSMDFSKKCLPEYLADAGYKNFFMQADTDINVHSVKDFFAHRDLQMPDLAAACLQNATKCVNHFLSDREFYNEFFHFTENLSPKEPHFFALATLQNHMPFTFAPISEWFYAEPKNRYENYINSVRHTDKQIAYFFEKLSASPFYENSLVIITGDHAFPLGERGNDRNENFAYQENFDVPLIIVDHRNNLKNSHLTDAMQTASHLNLAPTILDLAGISAQTDFVGGSIFSASKAHRTVYMVQPHSGGYQALIRWPYKYIHSEIFRTEEIYDLASDPFERNPLSLKENESLVAQLRRQTSYIYSQQKLYEKNSALEARSSTAYK